MAPPSQLTTPDQEAKPVPPPKPPGGRLIELDILRGFLLLWMTLTHLPTAASILSNQTFGFVSGAEGFIFLSAFMVGQLEHRIEEKRGRFGALRDLVRRTVRVYLYHFALLVVAFALLAPIGVHFHRLAIQNLLSYYLADPKHALIAAAILEYRPSLLDILPMYVIFMALTPVAREIARRWSWEPVVYASFGLWAIAQFGLRAWIYQHANLFGLNVPESSTGAFDLYSWQLLWIVGLALGSITFSARSEPGRRRIPDRLWKICLPLAIVFVVLRYSPLDHWMNPDVYGWLIDKWHLGPARIINFSALAILVVRFGGRLAHLPFISPLYLLGQASIEVFSVHVLCCLAGHALSEDADPIQPWWQQTILLVVTISALFLTALGHRTWMNKRRSAS
jgi:hypothetical protein